MKVSTLVDHTGGLETGGIEVLRTTDFKIHSKMEDPAMLVFKGVAMGRPHTIILRLSGEGPSDS